MDDYHSAYRDAQFDVDGNFLIFIRQPNDSHKKHGYWRFNALEDERRAYQFGFHNPEAVLEAAELGNALHNDISMRWEPGGIGAVRNGPSLIGTAAQHLKDIFDIRRFLGQPLSSRGRVPVYPDDPRLKTYWDAKRAATDSSTNISAFSRTANISPLFQLPTESHIPPGQSENHVQPIDGPSTPVRPRALPLRHASQTRSVATAPGSTIKPLVPRFLIPSVPTKQSKSGTSSETRSDSKHVPQPLKTGPSRESQGNEASISSTRKVHTPSSPKAPDAHNATDDAAARLHDMFQQQKKAEESYHPENMSMLREFTAQRREELGILQARSSKRVTYAQSSEHEQWRLRQDKSRAKVQVSSQSPKTSQNSSSGSASALAHRRSPASPSLSVVPTPNTRLQPPASKSSGLCTHIQAKWALEDPVLAAKHPLADVTTASSYKVTVSTSINTTKKNARLSANGTRSALVGNVLDGSRAENAHTPILLQIVERPKADAVKLRALSSVHRPQTHQISNTLHVPDMLGNRSILKKAEPSLPILRGGGSHQASPKQSEQESPSSPAAATIRGSAVHEASPKGSKPESLPSLAAPDLYPGLVCMECEEEPGHKAGCYLGNLKPIQNLTMLDYRNLADSVERFDPGPWTAHQGPHPKPEPEDQATVTRERAEMIRNEESFKSDPDLHHLPDQLMILLWAFKTSPNVEVLEFTYDELEAELEDN